MSNMFEQFDKVTPADLAEKVREAADNQYEETPAGHYIAKIEKMELGLTNDKKRPMFRVQMRLISSDGEKEDAYLKKFKKAKPCIFMNRVLLGTKNDGNMIGSVVSWLNKLVNDSENPVVFTTYSEFAEEILDIAEDFADAEIAVEYDPGKFNSISIVEVY